MLLSHFTATINYSHLKYKIFISNCRKLKIAFWNRVFFSRRSKSKDCLLINKFQGKGPIVPLKSTCLVILTELNKRQFSSLYLQLVQSFLSLLECKLSKKKSWVYNWRVGFMCHTFFSYLFSFFFFLLSQWNEQLVVATSDDKIAWCFKGLSWSVESGRQIKADKAVIYSNLLTWDKNHFGIFGKYRI